jgi:hypothetical protein
MICRRSKQKEDSHNSGGFIHSHLVEGQKAQWDGLITFPGMEVVDVPRWRHEKASSKWDGHS